MIAISLSSVAQVRSMQSRCARGLIYTRGSKDNRNKDCDLRATEEMALRAEPS
jgi:hypothetical protein